MKKCVFVPLLALALGATNLSVLNHQGKERQLQFKQQVEPPFNNGTTNEAHGDYLAEVGSPYNDGPLDATIVNTADLSNYRRDYNFGLQGRLYRFNPTDPASGIRDFDYYTFKTYGDTKLIEMTMTCQSLNGYNWMNDYTFELYRDVVEVAQPPYGGQLVASAVVDEVYNSNIRRIKMSFNAISAPSIYYVKVFSKSGAPARGSDDYYAINGIVRYNDIGNIAINEVKTRDKAKMALWVSDYSPRGIRPFEVFTYTGIGRGNRFFDHSSPKQYEIETIAGEFDYNSQIEEQAVFYIWGTEQKTELKNFVGAQIAVMEGEIEKLKAEREQLMFIQVIYDAVTGIANLVCDILGIVYNIPIDFDIYDVSPAFAFLNLLFGNLIEGVEIMIDQYISIYEYLWVTHGLLDISEVNEDQVLRIPFYYGVTHHSNLFGHWYGTTYLKRPAIHVSSHPEHTEDIISSINPYSVFRGKVYPIRNGEDLQRAVNDQERYDPEINYIPSEYGFAEQYYFDERVTAHTLANGEEFSVKRLRTGFIDGKYLTMSAKTAGADTAYLEYQFDNPISSISYELGLWSNNESLILNSSIRFEILDNGNVISTRVFDPHAMSIDKDNLLTYDAAIPGGFTSFRFVVNTNQVNNNNNRGRVVIGDITFNY